MARARNIKPGFFQNEELVELPFVTRLLFIGLWTIADRAGRLEDKPKKIKMGLFPADNIEVEDSLFELAAKDFILRYEIDGIKYIQILAFEKHQNPHKDEKASTIPAPCKHDASTVPALCKPDGNRADSLIPDSLLLIPDKDPTPLALLVSLDVEKQFAQDWLKIRKGKKLPFTRTALDGMIREAEKAGLTLNQTIKKCCEESWAGFKASWLTDEKPANAPDWREGLV